jgi:glycosyltransferase involved in cell wall biosynthesis
MERAVLTSLGQIDRSRFDAHVLCYKNSGQLQKDFEALGLPIRVFPLHSWNMPVVALRIARYLRKEGIVLIHSHGYHADVVARMAARLADVVVVNTIHANSTWKRQPRGIVQRLRRWFDAYTAKKFGGGFIALTDSIQAFHVATLGYPDRNWRVIPNPLAWSRVEGCGGRRESVREELGVSGDGVLVLAVGNLRPVKGHRFLITALTLLDADGLERTELFIAGEGPLRADLESQIEELGLGEKVGLLGYREDVGDLLAAADIFVMPSISEGQSVAILEAMAMKVPLLVTRQGGHTDFLQDGESAVIVEPGNSRALAEGLQILIGSEQTRRRLASNAARILERLPVRQSTRLQAEFYQYLTDALP